MGMLEGFSLKNYGVLKDITLGKLWNDESGKSSTLTPMVVVIGKNGDMQLFSGFGVEIDAFE